MLKAGWYRTFFSLGFFCFGVGSLSLSYFSLFAFETGSNWPKTPGVGQAGLEFSVTLCFCLPVLRSWFSTTIPNLGFVLFGVFGFSFLLF